jgi:structural maintenance of chromosome 2
MFGKEGTQYDFAAVDMTKLKDKARELEETQKGIKKKINPKVLNMIDRCVAQKYYSCMKTLTRDIAWRRRRSG